MHPSFAKLPIIRFVIVLRPGKHEKYKEKRKERKLFFGKWKSCLVNYWTEITIIKHLGYIGE